ncbi:4-diphosphocytidyl-2-C-methyl-D-erythritol kinase [Gossypium arboreum]|uniref:4-diphosphocytidyl-2-C-methyl-D-erythritol kinase n=1 Tax=Gossypium arboreum TaxID=29729 RepID=A0A0B0N9T0_GOSAR|nr:4-diphosphocytidyl-2-C-methyl-D-erythritol kinase [Gossypium arboreum]
MSGIKNQRNQILIGEKRKLSTSSPAPFYNVRAFRPSYDIRKPSVNLRNS